MREEPADGWTMPVPADPWATADRPAEYSGDTAYLGDSRQTVHLGPGESAPTVRTQKEVRFGPGVPAAPGPPVAAPAWPENRPRPVRRRLTSLVSGLVTLALAGVAGFYLWERLSPLAVDTVTVAVPQPAGERCDVTVEVVATVRTNGRGGTIRYQWLRSDAPPGAVLTEHTGRGQDTVTLTLNWTFRGAGSAGETATLSIIEPTPIQAGTAVDYRCGRG